MNPSVKFEDNRPVELALTYPQGKAIHTKHGHEVVMYSLEFPSQHVMFLEQAVAEQLAQLGVQPGERFFACKRKNGRGVEWDLWLAPATEHFRAQRESERKPTPEPPSVLERQLQASIHEVRERKAAETIQKLPPGPAMAATYHSAMSEFLLIAGRVAAETEKRLGQEGAAVKFDSRDVMALATAFFIQAAREGRTQWKPGEVA